jgi:hypothetical protein
MLCFNFQVYVSAKNGKLGESQPIKARESKQVD